MGGHNFTGCADLVKRCSHHTLLPSVLHPTLSFLVPLSYQDRLVTENIQFEALKCTDNGKELYIPRLYWKYIGLGIYSSGTDTRVLIGFNFSPRLSGDRSSGATQGGLSGLVGEEERE